MSFNILFLAGLALLTSCGPENDSSELSSVNESEPTTFDRARWLVKEDSEYPYREQMLDDVLYNDTIRSLKEDELVELLGPPDRKNEGHLYYLISRDNIWFWTTHTKFLVVKISAEGEIEWIKMHG